MEKIVHRWECDRCNKTCETIDVYEPEGWKYIEKRLLCSDCTKKFKYLFTKFIIEKDEYDKQFDQESNKAKPVRNRKFKRSRNRGRQKETTKE